MGYYFFRFPGAIFGYFAAYLLEQFNQRSFIKNIHSSYLFNQYYAPMSIIREIIKVYNK